MKAFLILSSLLVALTGCAEAPPPIVEAHLCRGGELESKGADEPGTLAVSGTATLEVTPDVADVRMDLASTARTPSAAVAQLRERETELRSNFDAEGVGTDEVAVSTITLDPKTRWDTNRGVAVLLGYTASLHVTVTTPHFDGIPAVIEASAQAGVTSVSTQFRSTKLTELKSRVRDMALEAAKAKEAQFAAALGLEVARVIQVAELPSGTAWNAYGRQLDNMVANASEVALPLQNLAVIRPEIHPLTLTVNVTYALK
ncbi:MAG: SIMPL domain-containing protein [Myxococcota bacterium]